MDLPLTADITQATSFFSKPKIKWKARVWTNQIILHDSHTGPDVENVHDYLRAGAHKMGLLDIGYHALIERDGTVIETRPHDLIGSHTPGHNLDSIGVCLLGGKGLTGPEDNFTYAQKLGLFGYLAMLQRHYLRETDEEPKIRGHTELNSFVNRKEPCPCLDIDMLRDDFTYFKTYGVIP
jgi:hypothetical protein